MDPETQTANPFPQVQQPPDELEQAAPDMQQGPLSQAERLQIQRYQSGLSQADSKALSGEITPQLRDTYKKQIQGQLSPLLARQEQTQKQAEQKQAQQAMQAAALQATVANVNLQKRAEVLPTLIKGFTDPTTGEIEHFYPEESKGDGTVRWKPVEFSREQARKEAEAGDVVSGGAGAGTPLGSVMGPNGLLPQKEEATERGQGYGAEPFHQRIRNGAETEDYIDGQLVARNGKPVGPQGSDVQSVGMVDHDGVVTAQGLAEFRKRAEAQIPPIKGQGPGGKFLDPRRQAAAAQQRESEVFRLTHMMATAAEKSHAQQTQRTAISGDQQKRLDEKEKLQHDRLEAQKNTATDRADKLQQHRLEKYGQLRQAIWAREKEADSGKGIKANRDAFEEGVDSLTATEWAKYEKAVGKHPAEAAMKEAEGATASPQAAAQPKAAPLSDAAAKIWE